MGNIKQKPERTHQAYCNNKTTPLQANKPEEENKTEITMRMATFNPHH